MPRSTAFGFKRPPLVIALPALCRTLPAVIGGQAVLDGVMMRSPWFVSVVVRDVGGGVYTDTRWAPSPAVRRPWLALPFIRGVVASYDAIVNGARAIAVSASVPASSARLDAREFATTLGVGLVLALGLFFALPGVVMRLASDYLTTPAAVAGAEGALRTGFLIAYVAAMAAVPDLRRVYQYHGAEHKAMNGFDAGLPLDLDAARACSRVYERCGTSHLFVVMLVAVAAFSWLGTAPFAAAMAERFALFLVIAGASDELFRLAGRVAWLRPVLLPGVWLQRLTTREPDDHQLDVALRALRAVVEAGRESGPAPAPRGRRAPPPEGTRRLGLPPSGTSPRNARASHGGGPQVGPQDAPPSPVA